MKQTTPRPVLLGDSALGHAEEADVKVVESLSLRPAGRFLVVTVGESRKLALLAPFGHAGEAVVGRIAEYHQYGLSPA